MHDDMDAAQHDTASQSAVMERHWRDALRAGNVADGDNDARDAILSCLFHAGGTETQQSAERMGISLRFLSTATPVQEATIRDDSGPEATPEETVAYFRRALSKPPEAP
jgi:hypothetical protein